MKVLCSGITIDTALDYYNLQKNSCYENDFPPEFFWFYGKWYNDR